MKTGTAGIFCIVLLVIGVLTSTQFAYSERDRGKGKGKKHHHSSEMMKHLFKDQIKQLKSLRLQLAIKILPLEAELEVKHLELEYLWQADAIDEDVILFKTDEALEIEAKIRRAMTRHKLDIVPI